MVSQDEPRIQIDLTLLFETFYQLLKSAMRDEYEEIDLFSLIDLFEEIAQVAESDKQHVNTLIGFLLKITEAGKGKNQVEVLQRIAEIYSNLLLNLPSEILTIQIYSETISLIECLLQNYQSSHEPSHLSAFVKLALFLIFKFELLCDSFITNLNFSPNSFPEIHSCCCHFIEFVNRTIYPMFNIFIDNGMFNEIILTLFAIVNIYSKIYILINFQNLKPIIIKDESAYVTDIMLMESNYQFPAKNYDISMIRVYIADKFFEFGFLSQLLEVIAKIIFQFIKSNNTEFYKNCLDVLEFFIICFPFLNSFSLDIIFRSFEIMDLSGTSYEDDAKVEIFMSLNRLMARIIFFHPQFLMLNRSESFGKIIAFLKHISFLGKYQENLSLGILIRECLEILLIDGNEDLISIFHGLHITSEGESQQNSPCNSIHILLNLLTKIFRTLNSTASFFDDLIWENIKYILLSESNFEKLVK